MAFEQSSTAVPPSLDGEGGARPQVAVLVPPASCLKSWEEMLPRQEAFTLGRIAKTFNVLPSGVGMMALADELRVDFLQLGKFHPLPDWLGSIESLRASLLQLRLDPARDLEMLRRQPMCPLRQFLTPPARSLPIGTVSTMRALRAMVTINLLATKERLSQQIGSAMGHLLSGKEAFRLDIRSVDEFALRAHWAALQPTAPLAKLLAFSLEICGRILPNPFEIPHLPAMLPRTTEQKASPQPAENGHKTQRPEHGAQNLLEALLAEPVVAGVRIFSGIPILYRGLAPFELESMMPALFSMWKDRRNEECLAAFLTLFLRVMPSAFGKIGTDLTADTWLIVDARNGRFGWRLSPILDKSARDQGSQQWLHSPIVWVPFPAEIAEILYVSSRVKSGGSLASLFSTPPGDLAIKTKGLLRAMSRTSHRPTLSRLSRSWARYILAECRDEVYASAIGIDLTVGTTANFNYAKLLGERVRQICAAAYRRIGFSGQLPPAEIPDVVPARLPIPATGEAFVRAMHAEIRDVLAHLPQNIRVGALLEMHNRLARAFYALWKFLLAARPLQEETTTRFRIAPESGLVSFSDKRVSRYHERRVVLLPPTMQAWLATYISWLRLLAYRLSGLAGDLAQAVLSVTRHQLDGDRHPLFFKFKTALGTEPLGSTDLTSIFRPFCLENNCGRSFLDALFRTAGLGSAEIMGWVGRGNPGQEICGSWSAVVPMEFLTVSAGVLERWLGTLSLPPLPSLDPRRLVEKDGDWNRQRYVPQLLKVAPDWTDSLGVKQPCPYEDDGVTLAAAFPRFLREWRSAAPPAGWAAVAISLVLEDGICIEEELNAVLKELQSGVTFRIGCSQFVDVTSPRLGLRRVWLSNITLRLSCRAAAATGKGDSDWRPGLTRFAAQALQTGSAFDVLWSSARAYFTLHVPGVLSAWKKGEIFARTSRPQSVVRSQTGFCEKPSFAGTCGIHRQRLSKPISGVVADALKDIERGSAHRTVLGKMQTEAEAIQADAEIGSLAWFEAGYACHLAGVLENVFTLARYLSGCHHFLQGVAEAAVSEGLDNIIWPILIASSLPEQEQDKPDAPTRAAINHCLEWLGVDLRVMARAGPPPCAFLYAENISVRERACALELLKVASRTPGDAFHKAWVALSILDSGAFRWDEVAHIRLGDLELAGVQPHIVVTLESDANLKTSNACRVVPIEEVTAYAIASLHEIRAARFPNDAVVPLFGDANDERSISTTDHVRSLVTEALRTATGSGVITPHDLRGAFISRMAGSLLTPHRDKSLDTLALRQGIPEISALAAHGHAGVTIENYLCDLDVLWRQWVDVIVKNANYPPSLAFIAGLTGIPAFTYRKRMSRQRAQTFDVMEGFDGGQAARSGVRAASDLVLEGIVQMEWNREAEADGGITRRAAYIGLRLLGERQDSALLTSALPRETMERLEFGLVKLNGRRNGPLSAVPHVNRESFLQALMKTNLPCALAALPLSNAMLSRLMGCMEQVGSPWQLSSAEDIEELTPWLACIRSNGMELEVLIRASNRSSFDDRLASHIRGLSINAVRVLPARHFPLGSFLTVKFWSCQPGRHISSRPRASSQVAFLISVSAITLFIAKEDLHNGQESQEHAGYQES